MCPPPDRRTPISRTMALKLLQNLVASLLLPPPPRALCKLKPEARVESGKFAETYEKGRKRGEGRQKGERGVEFLLPPRFSSPHSALVPSFFLGRGWGLILASVRSERYGQGKKRTDGRNAEADGSEKEKRRALSQRSIIVEWVFAVKEYQQRHEGFTSELMSSLLARHMNSPLRWRCFPDCCRWR